MAECCQGACQISEWYDNFNIQYHGFETLWVLSTRCFAALCIEALLSYGISGYFAAIKCIWGIYINTSIPWHAKPWILQAIKLKTKSRHAEKPHVFNSLTSKSPLIIFCWPYPVHVNLSLMIPFLWAKITSFIMRSESNHKLKCLDRFTPHSGINLGMRPANERCRYTVTRPLIDWVQYPIREFSLMGYC